MYRWLFLKHRGPDSSTVTMTVQNILDQLCPGLLALGLTLLMVRLLNKKLIRCGSSLLCLA